MEKLEKSDMIIGGVLLLLLAVAYFAHRQSEVIAPIDTTQTAQPLNTYGPPVYNMPPTLTLPPFNQGNSPVSSASNGGDKCGCQKTACANSNNAQNFGTMLEAWNPNGGIKMPTNEVSPNTTLQKPSNISVAPVLPITPVANSYAVWRAKEGLDPPNPNTNQNTHQRDTIPAGLTTQQQFQLYQLLNGGLFGNTSIQNQNAIMDKIWGITT